MLMNKKSNTNGSILNVWIQGMQGIKLLKVVKEGH